MSSFKHLFVAVTAILIFAETAFAHHAVNSQFDITRNLPLTGVLTKFELINPHTYVHFDVKEPNGEVHAWAFETGAPIALKRAGLSVRETFKVGETYKLVYSPSRDGSRTGLMNAITLPDGRFVAFGAAQNVDAAKAIADSH